MIENGENSGMKFVAGENGREKASFLTARPRSVSKYNKCTIIQALHIQVGAPGIFSDLLRSVQMLNKEWGTGKQREATAPIYP